MPNQPDSAGYVAETGLRAIVGQVSRIAAGSGLLAIFKTGLVYLIDRFTPIGPWLNYLLVMGLNTCLGWLYHSRVSFRMPLTRESFYRFSQQAVIIKLLDYGLFNGLVYLVHLQVIWAVLLSSMVTFSVRAIVYIKYVFVPSDRERRPSGTGAGSQ